MSNLQYQRILESEGLIYKLANQYKNYSNFDDLCQAGCIGVIKADELYDESKSNCKFSTYAYKSIKGEMIDFLKKDKNIIVSDEVYDIYRKYTKIKDMLYTKYEREVTFSEVCKYMDIDEKSMLNIIESVSFAKSINDDETIYNDFSFDEREDVDNEILLKSELEMLDNMSQKLIDYRYYQGLSQMETASVMGLSQAKVSRQEKLILSKIKDNITN